MMLQPLLVVLACVLFLISAYLHTDLATKLTALAFAALTLVYLIGHAL